MPNPLFPFSDGTQFSTTMRTPWLGGEVIPISSGVANANFLISHGLRRVPRFALVLQPSTNINLQGALAQGTAGWNATAINVNVPSRGAPALVFLG